MEQKALANIEGLLSGEGQWPVNLRVLHEQLGVRQDFAGWVKARIEKYSFQEGLDFSQIFTKNNPGRGRKNIDYHATLHMAKELAIVENNEKGRQVRLYLIKYEERGKADENAIAAQAYSNIVNTPALANELILNQAIAIKELTGENLALAAQIEANAGKVAFADSVAVSDNAILVRQFAKILTQNGYTTGEQKFYATLRNDGYLIKKLGSDRNQPTQKSMNLGLFVVRETAITHSDGTVSLRITPKITGKGQVYFAEKYLGRPNGAAHDSA